MSLFSMTNVCFVFNGAGGYIAWYLGYAKYLQDNYDLSSATFAGTSAGSIVAIFLAAGISLEDVWHNWFLRILDELPQKFQFPNNEFVPIAKKHANKLLAAKSFKCLKGRVHISLTDKNIQRVSISEFHSLDDMLDCAIASCHVPWVINGSSMLEYRENWYLDGSLYNTVKGGGDQFSPCGDEMLYIRIRSPYQFYEQITSIYRISERDFHHKNYIDGFKYAEKMLPKTISQHLSPPTLTNQPHLCVPHNK